MKLVITLSTLLKGSGLILLVLSITSCGTGGDERPAYQGAQYYKNLKIPPGLTAPETRDKLVVPRPTEEALQRFRDNNKLDVVISPGFDGVRVASYAGNRWLEVDNNVEHVWIELQSFWQNEGISLAQLRPELGFMETQWIQRLDADAGLLRSMFQRFEPDQKDRFRVRVERFDSDLKTRLYITHSRIERVMYGAEGDGFIWQSQASSVDAEREILSRLMLFVGKSKSASELVLGNYRPFASLVTIDRNNATSLTMAGSMDFVWQRAMRALDRLRVQDIQAQQESNTIHFVVGDDSNEKLHVNDDELSESSWVMQLFNRVDENDLAINKKRHYRLEFSEVSAGIQIEVKDSEASTFTDEEGAVTGTALAEQLRDRLAEKLE